MRFHVDVVNADGVNLAAVPGNPQAGFSNVTTPEATSEAVEYKEGTDVYVRKYPGSPTVSDITLSRGVARGDSSFWHWMRAVIEGTGNYRADLDIQHYHRDNVLTRPIDALGNTENLTRFDPAAGAGRIYHVKEGFPTRHKVAGDLDATASEISVMELDIAYEYFEVEEGAVPA
jgi:phage tail-like protein